MWILLESGGTDEEKWEKDDAGTDEPNIEVELKVGLSVFRPGKANVCEEPGDAVVDHVRLQRQCNDAIPKAPERVAVDGAFPLCRRTSH